MAHRQPTNARLSEETVKRALEKYDRKKLIAHLSSVRLDGEAVDRLVAVMREGGLPLIKHPNPTADAKRVSCLAAVEHHIESALGVDEADKVRDFMALVERIEQGYRRILAASDASDGAELDPAVRVSALLEAGAREADAHQARLMEVIGEDEITVLGEITKSFSDHFFGDVEGVDGRDVHAVVAGSAIMPVHEEGRARGLVRRGRRFGRGGLARQGLGKGERGVESQGSEEQGAGQQPHRMSPAGWAGRI